MLSDYFSEINDHGTVVPVKDLAAFPRSEQAVLGASNQMPFPYYVASGYESQSVTYTYDDEGKVSASGTSTGDSTFFFFRQVPASQLYKFNGWFLKGLTGGTQGKVFLTLNQSTSPWTSYAQNIDGATKISGIPNDSTPVDCSFKIANGFSFSGVVKPQISLSADTPFAPYAMTNKELTEKKANFATIFMPYADKPVYTGDLDDLPTGCIYVGANATNSPSDWCVVYTVSGSLVDMPDATYGFQLAIGVASQVLFYRRKTGGAWTGWNQITMTAV